MENTGLAFLGKGLGFPVTFNKATGDIRLVEAYADIEESLQIILSTRPGERFLETDFGCNLDQMLFEPINLTLISYMREVVKTALILHEPRVDVNDVSIRQDDSMQGRVIISVDYTVRSTNSRFNFVFPFYQQEGTDLDT
ncbi:MAG TPA: GPW/gp25 family protein [Haliscomenobacter sp.]|uniref:GPW/gp25 family protein n=1 Tax=Haliscomenobacter sp. TaxID=2717303 RepID=UPI002C9197D6|nr:GPW/gp25 family protein [Haliscomenobacter sp.]HOY16504.1 GPW/gp25 family protein [Haliscomenobacter sp.]HPH17881.1 GPW/gp25 family protein [Haliscomenobacter sp.]